MAYYTDLFSPETYEAFSHSNRDISGFQVSQRGQASAIHPGDRLVCYMTRVSRWVGVLEVVSECFENDTPIFYPEEDPFVVRFRVRPIMWLGRDKAVPIREDRVWSALSFTRDLPKDSNAWTGKVRRSLTHLDDADGALLEGLLMLQASGGVIYPISDSEWKRLRQHRVRRLGGAVSVAVPEDSEEAESQGAQVEVRESIRMQAALAEIGARMGMRIWIPAHDRAGVMSQSEAIGPLLIDSLPLNYDETTLRTIEEIDVLWLRGRAITRAFEVEHTTSVYSGILRMADLLALQPNMDIKLHIVAPSERRTKVFQELRRPVFSLLERGPLAEMCTFLSYDSVLTLLSLKHLKYMTDSVLDEYAEEAE